LFERFGFSVYGRMVAATLPSSPAFVGTSRVVVKTVGVTWTDRRRTAWLAVLRVRLARHLTA